MNSLQTILNEVALRWNAPIEGFFKPVYRASLILLTLCFTVMFAQSTLVDLNLHVPAWLTTASGIAGSIGTLLSRLTIDREKLKLKQKIELATKYRVTDLKSPWYVTAALLVVYLFACAAWLILALIVATIIYRPAFWVIKHYVKDKAALRSRALRRRQDRVADLTYSLVNWPV